MRRKVIIGIATVVATGIAGAALYWLEKNRDSYSADEFFDDDLLDDEDVDDEEDGEYSRAGGTC